MDATHTLLVLRHAKAAGEPGVNDEQRPLAGHGRRDASAVGQWLAAQGITPDLVLCSSSRRTRETWARLSAALTPDGPDPIAVSFDPRVYDAGAEDLLDIIREQPDEAATVMTVGHNPASHQLAVDLTGRSDLAFPACALAVIRFGGAWADVVAGSGDLTAFWSPHTAS